MLYAMATSHLGSPGLGLLLPNCYLGAASTHPLPGPVWLLKGSEHHLQGGGNLQTVRQPSFLSNSSPHCTLCEPPPQCTCMKILLHKVSQSILLTEWWPKMSSSATSIVTWKGKFVKVQFAFKSLRLCLFILQSADAYMIQRVVVVKLTKPHWQNFSETSISFLFNVPIDVK